MRNYYLANKKHCNSLCENWRRKKKNRIKVNAWARTHRNRYIEKIRQQEKIKGRRYRLNNPEKIKLRRKLYKALRRKGGKLSIKTIQLVYEDNIKKYGTLTCIYCLKPIQFGQDTLEHKQPLSRNGTNKYKNLAIACYSCNSRKNNKTEKEYRKMLKSVISAGRFFFVGVCHR